VEINEAAAPASRAVEKTRRFIIDSPILKQCCIMRDAP
jgi:hypothetical protein